VTGSHPDTVRVLHVDDDPALRELTAEVLGREGGDFEVTTAANAEEGLAALDERPIDCVVSDYEMPGRNGLEFLEAVRDRDPDLPFVLFTGKRGLASDAIARGATDFMEKAGGADQYLLLRNRIENAVARRRASRRLDR
jgi:DNA-binding NtrC family response regulator